MSCDAWCSRFVELDNRGYVHKSIVYPAILTEFGGADDMSEALLSDYRERCCLHARAMPQMKETLLDLRARGLKLAIVTNGETDFQTRNIRALGLNDLVHAILISEHEQLRKPDRELFYRAAQRLQVLPAQCLFVGDNPTADILGAHAAGMRTVWFNRGGDWPEATAIPGPIVSKLSDVLRHLN